MDHYNRGRPQGYYTSGYPIQDEGLDDIQPDYDDEPSPRDTPGRNVTGHRSPVDFVRGGHRVSRSGSEMDRSAYPSSGDPSRRRYRSPDNVNRGGDRVNQGFRDSGDDFHRGGIRASDREHSGYGQEFDGPVRQRSRQGSGAYDNQIFSPPADDYERGRYEQGRQRSPEVMYNQGFQMMDNGGYDASSRDFMSDSHPQVQRRMHGDGERGRDSGHYIQHNGRHYRTDEDAESVFTIDFGHTESDNVWNKLHTIKLRRKSRKSRKSARTLSRRGGGDEYSDNEVEEDEGIMPSLQIRKRPKSLHDRLAEVRSTTEVAETLRENANLQGGGVSLVQHSIKQTLQKNKSRIKGWLYQLELWATTFKEIEGRFGTATVSYFRFTRWLMFLNLYIFLLMFCVVVIPYAALRSPTLFNDTLNINKTDTFFIEAAQCTQEYKTFNENFTANEKITDKVLDFFQGTGWMERTELFYGVYRNRTYPLPDNQQGTYNMSLAYLLTTGFCFLISFILIVKNSGKSVKEAVVDQESSKTLYCNKVFCGWDYCMTNEKAAGTKMRSYVRELQDDLRDERLKMEQAKRTTKEKCSLFFIRVFVNLFVVCTLGAALFLIYYTTDQLLKLEKQQQSNEFLALVIQYLPSLTITVLNFLVPLMFTKVVIVENYGGAFELKITLIRTVLLRLASLGVLLISLYLQLLTQDDDSDEKGKCGNQRWVVENLNDTSRGSSIKCWETYVGQQFYKLALLDFVSVVLLTFLVEFPRRFVYQKLHNKFKLIKLVGEPEFDLPKNVLDIVYSQTLCWLGMFFSPMIPAITLMKVLIIFYVKRLSVFHICVPPIRPYRASRSNSFFMTVLLISFVLTVIPLGYLIGNISPSQSCGPFRVYSQGNHVMFDTITNTVRTWPVVAKEIFFYLGTVGFFVPAIILLCLLMYYYWAASQGYKKMEQLLKEQLKMEGRDRQFLLSRVQDVMVRGELGTVTG